MRLKEGIWNGGKEECRKKVAVEDWENMVLGNYVLKTEDWR